MKHRAKPAVSTSSRRRKGAAVASRLALAIALAALGLAAPAVPAMAAAPTCDAPTFAAAFNGAADGATVTLCGDVTIAADDNLPLAVASGKAVTLDLNGHTLDVTAADFHAGIDVPDGAALTIKDTSSPSTGKLAATGGQFGAGIGGANGSAGTITIDSGTVTANGGYWGAGIGAANNTFDAGTITINGGTVTAIGQATCDRAGFDVCGGAGIGAGGGGKSGTITINDGTVVATGNGFSAGIGGGGASGGSNDGTILITGGDVTATGGNDDFAGAGIGAGGNRTAGPVSITGGTVSATGGQSPGTGASGAGIGTGNSDGAITISGGTVTATAGTVVGGSTIGGSGIGAAGCVAGPRVTITGSSTSVTATGVQGGAGIGGGGCTSSGAYGSGGDVTVGAGAAVVASSDSGNAIGNGAGSTGFGSLDNAGTITLGSELSIPSGTTVTDDGTITTDGTITNNGTIKGSGALDGTGTIDNAGAIWHTITVSDRLTVTDHHYQLSFDANGGAVGWGGATPWSVVDGSSLSSVGRTTADFPTATRPGYTFTGWTLDANGIAPVTDDTTLPGSSSDGSPVAITLHAEWKVAASGPLYAYPDGGATLPTACPAVTGLSDACTLTQALGLAQSEDTVILAADPGTGDSATFTTQTGWDVPQKSLTIKPDTGVDAILDGQHTAPHLLDYSGSGTLTVTNLTVANSVGSPNTSGPGGGIVNRHGALTVTDSTFSDNSAHVGYGGGILNWTASSTLSVAGSTFVDNNVTEGGQGAGIYNIAGGSVTVSQSTFARNGSGGGGAGVLTGSGDVTITASTFVDNFLGLRTRVSAVSITITASLFAGNTRGGCRFAGTAPIDAGYNIESDDSCGFTEASSVSNSEHLSDLLNPLADNGGPTQTVAPKPGSPAVGMIPNGTSVTVNGESVALCPTTDQRGVASEAGKPCNAGSVQTVVGTPLAISTDSLPGGTLGTTYGPTTLQAAGGTAPYTWRVSDGSLPRGLRIDSDTGTIAGTPTQPGTASFTVEVSDANAVAVSKELSITIAVPAAHVTVHDGDGQTADAGTDFGTPLSVSVTDARGKPVTAGTDVTFTVAGGDAAFGGRPSATAPTNADGVAIAPTLTAGSTAGAVTVEATVAGVDESAVFTETVAKTQASLTVVTADLPDGTVGVLYRQALKATGAADGVYHWAVADGALPDGLHLSDGGVVSGTPTTAGTFAFTVSVNDPATAELTIVVKPATAGSPSPSTGAGPTSAAGPNPTSATGPNRSTAGELATTGVPTAVLPAGIVGLILVLAGGLALAMASRRRRAHH